MARDQQRQTFDDMNLQEIEAWLYARLGEELFPNRVALDIAAALAPHVQTMAAGRLVEDRVLDGRLGELVSGERVLLRRAVGIVADLQKLEGEVRAVLDAFTAPDGYAPDGYEPARGHVAELRAREARAMHLGKSAEAAILHNAAQRLAGELDALIPDPDGKIKD